MDRGYAPLRPFTRRPIVACLAVDRQPFAGLCPRSPPRQEIVAGFSSVASATRPAYPLVEPRSFIHLDAREPSSSKRGVTSCFYYRVSLRFLISSTVSLRPQLILQSWHDFT